MLFAVEESTEGVYYVCLWDYIPKILRPETPNFEDQESVTIRIPAWNVLDVDDPGFGYFRLLGRRAKLYAAFNVFHYQQAEFRRRTGPGCLSFSLLQDDTVVLASDLRA